MEADRFGNNKVRGAILDTNILMYVFLNRVDVITQLREEGFTRFAVTSSVLKELEKLEKSLKGKERRAAKFARKLVESFEVIETQTTGDSSLLEGAEKHGYVLITNDKELKKKARARSIPVGYLKKNRRVVVD
ncbi:type II toxin-antitoxin system VapC family toxin [Archaeoglobus neptunius]|uniref:type II toxin-antitoxin system VapC family toxin n=1 Tax=Archaeoglobus neptunius TaxID=2798580 RepID=UPI0019273911|nr:PIN domain-containing protein [Archaeoglobus neptunius]